MRVNLALLKGGEQGGEERNSQQRSRKTIAIWHVFSLGTIPKLSHSLDRSYPPSGLHNNCQVLPNLSNMQQPGTISTPTAFIRRSTYEAGRGSRTKKHMRHNSTRIQPRYAPCYKPLKPPSFQSLPAPRTTSKHTFLQRSTHVNKRRTERKRRTWKYTIQRRLCLSPPKSSVRSAHTQFLKTSTQPASFLTSLLHSQIS